MIPFHNGSATLNIDQQLGAGGQRESGKLSRIINHSETAAHVLRIPFTINTFFTLSANILVSHSPLLTEKRCWVATEVKSNECLWIRKLPCLPCEQDLLRSVQTCFVKCVRNKRLIRSLGTENLCLSSNKINKHHLSLVSLLRVIFLVPFWIIQDLFETISRIIHKIDVSIYIILRIITGLNDETVANKRQVRRLELSIHAIHNRTPFDIVQFINGIINRDPPKPFA